MYYFIFSLLFSSFTVDAATIVPTDPCTDQYTQESVSNVRVFGVGLLETDLTQQLTDPCKQVGSVTYVMPDEDATRLSVKVVARRFGRLDRVSSIHDGTCKITGQMIAECVFLNVKKGQVLAIDLFGTGEYGNGERNIAFVEGHSALESVCEKDCTDLPDFPEEKSYLPGLRGMVCPTGTRRSTAFNPNGYPFGGNYGECTILGMRFPHNPSGLFLINQPDRLKYYYPEYYIPEY